MNPHWLVLPLLLVGCGAGNLSPQERTQRCERLATTIATANLRTTPDEQTARDVADRMDDQLSRLGAPSLHGPAVEVHSSLHSIERLRQRGNAAEADRAAGRARTAITRLAEACNVPEAAFYGEPAPPS